MKPNGQRIRACLIATVIFVSFLLASAIAQTPGHIHHDWQHDHPAHWAHSDSASTARVLIVGGYRIARMAFLNYLSQAPNYTILPPAPSLRRAT